MIKFGKCSGGGNQFGGIVVAAVESILAISWT